MPGEMIYMVEENKSEEEKKKDRLEEEKKRQEEAEKTEQENLEKGKEEKELNDKKAFNIQCFLVDNMEAIVDRKVSDTQAETQYRTFTLIEGQPAEICQEIVSRKGVADFFNLTPAQKALLVPRIRLYKVVYSEGGPKGGKDIELLFADHTRKKDIEEMTKNARGRGDDVGLKSFSYRMKGVMPDQGGLMECSMTLFFSNASSFLNKRDNGVSFVDLIWDKKSAGKTGDATSQKNFRVKAVVGWNVPVDNGKLFTANLKKALEKTSTTLYMTHVRHDLEFNEDGSLSVTIEFAGAMDGVMDDPDKANVFYKTEKGIEADNIKAKLTEQEKKEKGQKKEPSISAEPHVKINVQKDVKDLPEKEQQRTRMLKLEQEDKQERYSRITRELYERSQTYYIDIDSAMIREFTEKEHEQNVKNWKANGKDMTDEQVRETERQLRESTRRIDRSKIKIYRVIDEFNKKRLEKISSNLQSAIVEGNTKSLAHDENDNFKANTKDKTESEKNKIITEKLSVPSNIINNPACPDCIRAYYFYFGDLLDILFDNYLLKREDVENIKILIGQFVYRDPRTKEEMTVNIADIPISLDSFMTWYAQRVISSQTEIYTIGAFVKDVLSNIVMSSLGERCFGGAPYSSPHINFNTMSVPLEGGEPILTVKEGARVKFNTLKARPDQDVVKKSDIKSPANLYHILYIFASNYVLPREMKGDRKTDMSRGIYHLSPGLDRGLVKSIKFKKEVLQYGPEATLESKSRDTIISPNVYNATVNMIGNNLFRNDSFVYIDVSRMGMGLHSDISDSFNLGGYYNIVGVSFEFSNDGDYSTTLDARWQGAKERPDTNVGPCAVTNSEVSSAQLARQQSRTTDGKVFDIDSGREQSIGYNPKGRK